jgi:hypothetical protein
MSLTGLTLLATSLLMLWPGLYGGFYLDDFPNLSNLPGPNDSYLSSLSYLLDTPVGGSGRPIAYLTFLLQAESWPGQPFPFKFVNLLIHLINGALVCVLAYLIGKAALLDKEKSRSLGILSLFAGFVWVILPMNLSTVFYVVQRMTLLSTSMTLIALIGFGYLRARHEVWSRREYLSATCVIGIGYLGVFAKETAILTGLLVLAIEYAVFSNNKAKLSRAWKLSILILPLALVFGYLLMAGRIFSEYSYRAFSFSERLLAENVIVLDYLGKILVPTNARINLYNDGYPFQEVAGNYLLVGLAILVWGILLLVALSRKSRLVSLGVLFFLAGHVLESTVIPLELYFEHRNYLPSAGLVIALVLGLGVWILNLRQVNRLKGTLALVLIMSWVGWLGVVSAVESRVWGDPRAFSIAAFTERPGSLRARQEIATYLMGAGDYMGAANVLYSVDREFGIFAGTYSQLLMLKCFEADVPLPEQVELISIFENAQFDRGTGPALQDIWRMKRSKNDQCQDVSNATLLAVIEALLRNPAYKERSNLHVLNSLVLADQGQWIQAAEAINRIGRGQVTVDELVLGARYYGQARETEKALAMLDEAEILVSGPLGKIVHLERIQSFRSTIISKESEPSDRENAP